MQLFGEQLTKLIVLESGQVCQPCGVIIPPGVRGKRGVTSMVGTVALVLVITVTALAVVLYAAYCEAGEDLPCKKARKKARTASSGVGHATHPKGGS